MELVQRAVGALRSWRRHERLRRIYAGAFTVRIPAGGNKAAPRPRRIVHLLEHSLPHRQNGYTLRSAAVVRAQQELGWDPVVLTGPGFPARGDATVEIVGGVPHQRLPGLGLDDKARLPSYLRTYVREASSILGDLGPFVLHAASNFRNAYAARELARHHGCPWVYEVRGLWEETLLATEGVGPDDPHYQRLVAIETRCMRAADAIVTLGAPLAGAIAERGVDPGRIFLVPNAIDPRTIRAGTRRQSLRASLDLGDRFTVAYIGSVTRLESLHTLVDAMAALASEGRDDIAALVVGDGGDRARLEQRAAEMGVRGCMHFVGSIPHREIADYYSVADAVVCTRGHERACELVTPLKPYEAMGHGVPVIGSDLPALREAIRDGDTGRLVPAANPGALARVISELADAPEMRRMLAERARRWVHSERTWEMVAARYEEVYACARATFTARGARRA